MSDYLLSCDDHGVGCTMVPYVAPPSAVDHYAFAANWTLWPAAALILVFIVSIAIVRYNAHAERGETERTRISNPPKQCPTCGDKLEAV